jgi:hypothetical protein
LVTPSEIEELNAKNIKKILNDGCPFAGKNEESAFPAIAN